MATDKKSFLLYCDIIHTIDQLTDEQAGHLFKHILQYVNDKDPETDNVITKIAFEPIKQSLKRDLQKYEDIRKRNSENARKRWYAIAYDRIPEHTKNADSVSVSGSGSVIEKVKNKKVFMKPTIEQVKEYMQEIEFNGDAEYFFNYYESNGWIVGRAKMKDWKSAVQNWKRRDRTFSNKSEQQIPNRPKLATL